MLKVKHRNSIRRFVVFLSLIVFVTANVGMAVYTHTCSIAGTEKSFFLSYEDPCSDDHPVKKKTCCSEEEKEEEHMENSCCSTDTDYVALDIDTRVEKSDIQLVYNFLSVGPAQDAVFYFLPEITTTFRQRLEYSNLPPPRYQGRDLQSINQVYRI